MPNSIDFRADQIQTKQIIVTGSGAGTTKLLIYGIEAQGSLVNEGDINTTYFPQDGIGGDLFLYVSGAVNSKGSAVRGTSVFGGDLVVSGSLSFAAGVRHAIKVVDAAANPTTDMTRSDYLVLVNTNTTNATVVLPEITDIVADLGLTVEIRQMDTTALSGRIVIIQPHASNSSYKILGFDNETASIKLGSAASPPGANTNRSVTLTFMGLGDGAYNKWIVIATSTC
jgi:hypothetical protein